MKQAALWTTVTAATLTAASVGAWFCEDDAQRAAILISALLLLFMIHITGFAMIRYYNSNGSVNAAYSSAVAYMGDEETASVPVDRSSDPLLAPVPDYANVFSQPDTMD